MNSKNLMRLPKAIKNKLPKEQISTIRIPNIIISTDFKYLFI
jgi:hypothetical protein